MSQPETLPPPPATLSGPITQTRVKRQLRNLLLDAGFQLRYTLLIVATSVVLTGGLGWMLYSQTRENSALLNVEWLGAEGNAALQRETAAGDRKLALLLAGFGVVLTVVLFGYGIVFTHKVAGPLHKISGYMGQVRRGRLGPIGELRKGDQLRGFYDDFKHMHNALREHTRREAATLAAAVAALEPRVGDDPDARLQLEALRALQVGKENSLK